MTLLLSAFEKVEANFCEIQGVSGNGQNQPGTFNNCNGLANILTVENGQMRAYLDNGHQPTDGDKLRTEIYLTPDNFYEYWYGWEFKLPSTNWAGFKGPMTIGQMHDKPNIGNSTPRHPNFMLQVYDENLCIVWPQSILPEESIFYNRIPILKMEWDKWYFVCIHINWKTTTAGFREVFVDRIPVYREWNVPTSYNDMEGPYLKLGIYNTSGQLPGEKLAYYRNLKRWMGNDGYQLVLGGVPALPPHFSEI